MKLPGTSGRPGAGLFLSLGMIAAMALPSAAGEPGKYVITPLAEDTVAKLPEGPLYWRIETFPELDEAEAFAGGSTLAAEAAGKAWLFTLGPKGDYTPGADMVAEIGPVPRITAPEYLLRVNLAGGPPGAKTSVHSHPGSEIFYVLSGELTHHSPQGVVHVAAGESTLGSGLDKAMEAESTGSTDLVALVMFVVDATRPFSSPSHFD